MSRFGDVRNVKISQPFIAKFKTNNKYISLDVLLCSIAEYFYELLYFDSPYGLVKIRHNS